MHKNLGASVDKECKTLLSDMPYLALSICQLACVLCSIEFKIVISNRNLFPTLSLYVGFFPTQVNFLPKTSWDRLH